MLRNYQGEKTNVSKLKKKNGKKMKREKLFGLFKRISKNKIRYCIEKGL